MAAPKLHTLAEAGELLGVSAMAVLRKVHAGEITTINVGSKNRVRLRIRDDDLLHYIEEHTVETAESA